MIKFIKMPARAAKEALFGYNDVFPGDLVDVHIGSLAREAAHLCATRMIAAMEAEILAAFRSGMDYVVIESGPELTDCWTVKFAFRGRPSTPGEFDEGLPLRWRLYRLKDWQEGKMA